VRVGFNKKWLILPVPMSKAAIKQVVPCRFYSNSRRLWPPLLAGARPSRRSKA
jgi:hypothetical protein